MNAKSKHRLLILDADMTPALTIVRSLRKKNAVIDVASHCEFAICKYSRYPHQHYLYPSPLTAENEFIEWLKRHLAAHPYDLVIPVTERTLIPISKHLNQFKEHQFAIAPLEGLDVALNKSRTLELAAALNIPTPNSTLIKQFEELPGEDEVKAYPVVIKPARSVGDNGSHKAQLSVEYAFSHNELKAKTRHALQFGDAILQSYFKGQGIGVEVIAKEGCISYAFQHLRLHEVPLTGGGSSLRKSTAIEPILLNASEKLIESLKWTGVAMIEFKWNPQTREYCLMEINGRFWGSLPVADAAGADFPGMLYDMMLLDSTGPYPPYKNDIYSRKLSSDIYWHELVLRKIAPQELNLLPSKKQLLKDLLLFFSPRHHLDVQSIRDPLPGLVDLKNSLKDYTQRAKGILDKKKRLKKQQDAWTNQSSQQLSNANSILFVCYGNINRSALAEHYFQHLCKKNNIESLSAGFHQQNGRPADPVMTKIALTQGIDMRNHKSCALDANMVSHADIIFVMEQHQLTRFNQEYPNAEHKTYLLGLTALTVTDAGEIPDPYGEPVSTYQHCYNQVTQCVKELFKAYTDS